MRFRLPKLTAATKAKLEQQLWRFTRITAVAFTASAVIPQLVHGQISRGAATAAVVGAVEVGFRTVFPDALAALGLPPELLEVMRELAAKPAPAVSVFTAPAAQAPASAPIEAPEVSAPAEPAEPAPAADPGPAEHTDPVDVTTLTAPVVSAPATSSSPVS